MKICTQASNDLDIEVIGENEVVIARIKVTNPYPYEYIMDVFPVVYPYPDKRIDSSTLKLDVKGHGYKLTRKASKEDKEHKHDYRTCENSVPCLDCEMIDKGEKL